MTVQESINLVFSFLGGGVVVAVINWIQTARSERANRSAQFLSDQLRLLYGPLNFYVSQNEHFAKLHGVIHEAYNAEYCNKNWSDDEVTQANLDKQTKATIELGNRYSALMVENNNQIAEIIRSNFSLIDPGDVDLLQSFVTHCVRCQTEAGEVAPPFRIYMRLGTGEIYRSDFVRAIQTRFTEKAKELAQLRRLSTWRPFRSAEVPREVPTWPIHTPRRKSGRGNGDRSNI